MRCFLGCDLTPKAKMSLDEWRDKALEKVPTHHPVKPANFHITTVFLGQIQSSQLDHLVNYIDSKLPNSKCSPFRVSLDDIVCWEKPKIVAAIPSEVPAPLTKLYEFSLSAAKHAQIALAGNFSKYRPHTTIIRKAKPETVAPPLFQPSIETEVTHLHLFESISGKNGVRYESRFSFMLPSQLSVREQLAIGGLK